MKKKQAHAMLELGLKNMSLFDVFCLFFLADCTVRLFDALMDLAEKWIVRLFS